MMMLILIFLGVIALLVFYVKFSEYKKKQLDNKLFYEYITSAKAFINQQNYYKSIVILEKAVQLGIKDKREVEILIGDCLLNLNLWNDVIQHKNFKSESVILFAKLGSLCAIESNDHEQMVQYYSRLLKIDAVLAKSFSGTTKNFNSKYYSFIFEWNNADTYLKKSIIKALNIEDIQWLTPIKNQDLSKIYENLHHVEILDLKSQVDARGRNEIDLKYEYTYLSNLNILSMLDNLKRINLHSQKFIADLSILGLVYSLEEINLSYTGVKDISFISNLHNLRILILTDYHNLAKLDYSPIYSSNTLMVLDVNGRKDIDFAAFRKDSPLRILFANDSNLQDFNDLNNLRDLTTLSVKNVEFVNYNIKLPKLERVYFGKIEEIQKLNFLDVNPNVIISKEPLLNAYKTGFYSNILQWSLDWEKKRLEISRIYEYLDLENSYPIFYDPNMVFDINNEIPPLTKPVALKNNNTPVGRSELGFYNILYKRWPQNIIRNYGLFLSEKYPPRVPDIVYFDEENSICIDIEIDEPYSFKDKIPTHFDFTDTSRDFDFITKGWRIIRFKEDDVLKNHHDCLAFVEQVIDCINKRNSGENTIIKKPDALVSPRWSIEDVNELIAKNHRGKLFLEFII